MRRKKKYRWKDIEAKRSIYAYTYTCMCIAQCTLTVSRANAIICQGNINKKNGGRQKGLCYIIPECGTKRKKNSMNA